MTFGELRETVAYQAGIPDVDALGGWLDQEIKRRLDELTGAHKYSELYRPNIILSLTAGSNASLFPIYPTPPGTKQRLDLDSVIYLPDNDPNQGYKLLAFDQIVDGLNIGEATHFIDRGNQLELFPWIDIATVDKLRVNFWTKATDSMGDSSVILVPQLEQTLLNEMVQEATALMGDRTRFTMAIEKGKRSYGRSFGISRGGSMNH